MTVDVTQPRAGLLSRERTPNAPALSGKEPGITSLLDSQAFWNCLPVPQVNILCLRGDLSSLHFPLQEMGTTRALLSPTGGDQMEKMSEKGFSSLAWVKVDVVAGA